MMPHKIFLLFFINSISTTTVSGSIQNEVEDILKYTEKHESKSKCVLSIAKNNLKCGTVISLATPEDELNFWLKSLSTVNCYVVTNIQNLNSLSDAYIIIHTKNSSKIEETIKQLANSTFWNPRANFIIFFENLSNHGSQYAFNLFLKYNILNVIVIDYRETKITKAYTYFPYDNGACGKHTNKIVALDTCENTVNAFSEKLKNGLRNCSLTVAITENTPFVIFENSTEFHIRGKKEGMEQYIISDIAKRENISINYLLASQAGRHGIVLANRSSTGLLEYLDNNSASMIAGGFLVTMNRAEKYDYAYRYNYPIIQLFISSSRAETWKKIYKKFDGATWMLIGISYFSVSVTIIIMRHLFLKSRYSQTLFLQIWGYFFGNTDNNLVKEKKLRSIMIYRIWFTFFICNFYTTTFYGFLSRYHKEKLNINFYDLSSLPFKPCIDADVRTFFEVSFNLSIPGKDTGKCKIEDETLDVVADKLDLYTVEFEYTYVMRKHEFTDDEGNPKLDYWDLANTISGIFTNRGCPFVGFFQKRVQYYFESGLVSKHLEKIYSFKRPNEYNLKKSKFKAFRLDNLRIIFIILFLSYFISTLIFIVEISSPPRLHSSRN